MQSLFRFRLGSSGRLPVTTRMGHLLGALLVLVLVAISGSALPSSTHSAHSAPLTQAPPPNATWADGDVFVALDNGQYAHYNNSATLVETFTDGTSGGNTGGCTFDAQGRLYTTNYDIGVVVRYDATAPHYRTTFSTGTQGGDWPESVVVAANGDLYVGHALGNRDVQLWNVEGTPSWVRNYNVGTETGVRGSDWIDLSADQHTLVYTSEGRRIMRYDLATPTQVADLTTLPTGTGNVAYGMQILAEGVPPGDSGGGVLVADRADIKRVDSTGTLQETYDVPNHDLWFDVAVDWNGRSFWAVDIGQHDMYRFAIVGGGVEVGPITISATSTTSGGICVKGGITAALPTSTPTNTPTNTPTKTSTPTNTPTNTPLSTPPKYTLSYYMRTPKLDQAAKLGCKTREDNIHGTVFLDFGEPVIVRQGPPIVYGTQLIHTNTRPTLDDIRQVLTQFAMGYSDPVSVCGQPTPPSTPQLLILAGVNNSALQYPTNGVWHDNLDLTKQHGQAWAHMLDAAYDELEANKLMPGVTVGAGFDAEYYGLENGDCRDTTTGRRGCDWLVSTGADEWTVYDKTRDGVPGVGARFWAEGYDEIESQTHHLPDLVFGNCSDCPRTGGPPLNPPVATPTWTADQNALLERMYHMNWELNYAFAYPQIYLEPYPYEWYNVRWHVSAVHGSGMVIQGAMTECSSSGCLGKNASSRLIPRFDVACEPGAHCTQGDWVAYSCLQEPCQQFPPSQGWQALLDMLSSPRTPEHVLNPNLPPQSALPRSITDIGFQPILP